MSNPSSVVKDTPPVVGSEGRTPVEEGKITESSSPDDSKSSDAVDSEVLALTISKVSSEDSTSTEERSTLSELEEMKAEMVAMQAKIKEQEETIIRLNSSSAQSQSSSAQERELGMFDNSEFVNQLSTSGEKFNTHLSNKGEGFDAYLSTQGEKLAARLDENQKDSGKFVLISYDLSVT